MASIRIVESMLCQRGSGHTTQEMRLSTNVLAWKRALFAGMAAVAGGCFAFAMDYDLPVPLPPPPELVEEYDSEADGRLLRPHAAGRTPEETRSALTPPPRVTVTLPSAARDARPQPPAGAASAPVQTAPARPALGEMNISPPSRFMPADYFNLPMDEDGVPGVVLPEINYDFQEPGGGVAARAVRSGLSVRQLEPFFALAKGSEGEALEARGRGENDVFAKQLSNAIRAYMDIVENADAGSEAREEAWYGVARCEYRLGNWWRAFDALERSFPAKFEKSEVAGRIKLEMFIGERLWRMGSEPVADALSNGQPMTGYQAASRVYAAAVFNQPTATDAPLALLRRGDAAAMEGDWTEAARFYRQVVEYFPESESAMQARSSLTESIYRQEWPAGFPEAARSDVASIMDDVERADSRLSEEAEERRQRAVSVANGHEAETKLRHAKQYLNSLRVRKSRDAAVFLLGEIVSRYPDTPQAVEAADILLGMGIDPPMRLSDGSRFPIPGSWSGDGTGDAGLSGGSVELDGQDYIGSGALPPSPSRETIFSAPDDSLFDN